MIEDQVANLINKVVIAEGEIQRIIIWLSRLHKDLSLFEKDLISRRPEGNDSQTETK